jgi:hypothetical protein
MAMYIPPGRRRRRLLLSIGVAVVIGLGVGVIIGRATAPTVDDRVGEVRDAAAAAVAQLQALPIEYQKQASGDQQFKGGGGVDDALARTRSELDDAVSEAPWLTGVQIDAVHGAVDDLRTAARSGADPSDFETQTRQAVDTITAVFGDAS